MGFLGEYVQLNNYHIVNTAIKSFYEKLGFERVYDLIEFIAKILAATKPRKISVNFKDECNFILERESANWRFVYNEITPITKPYEVQSIEEAFEGVGQETLSHLHAMLRNFSQKGEKNYRGTANEAMLAVEAFAREVTREKSKILSILCSEGKLPMHKSLQKSLSQLYGYANDEIRHAQKKGCDEVDYELAKFFVLQCTSFINLMKKSRHME